MKNKLLYLLVSIFLVVICVGGYVEAQQGPASGPGGGGATGPTGPAGSTGPTGPTGVAGGFTTITVPLTANQINHLFSAPVTALAAPGAGKAYKIRFVDWFNHVGSIPTGSQIGSSGNVLLTYANASGLIIAGDAGLLEAFASSFLSSPIVTFGGVFAPASGSNIPTSSLTSLYTAVSNQTLVLSNSTSDYVAYGAIATSGVTSGHAGTLYVVNDTGTISGGNGGAGGVSGTYIITSVSVGGVVTGFTVTSQGDAGYTTSTGNATATGGAQPGIGTGFQVDINSITPGNGAGSVVIEYETQTLP